MDGLQGVNNATRTLVSLLQHLVFTGLIANVYSINQGQNHSCDTLWNAYFFQPAADKHFAYKVPIAPMPISPMAGCSSRGASGVTVDFVIPTAIARKWRVRCGCRGVESRKLYQMSRPLICDVQVGERESSQDRTVGLVCNTDMYQWPSLCSAPIRALFAYSYSGELQHIMVVGSRAQRASESVI